jgi:hypothetical protein
LQAQDEEISHEWMTSGTVCSACENGVALGTTSASLTFLVPLK